jgi:predicted TIM-barrel fold metal-dependent hydrolase
MPNSAQKQSMSTALEYYSLEDYYSLKKYDVHVHVLTYDPRFIEQSGEDGFSLLSINVEVSDYPSIEEQQALAKHHYDVFPHNFAYCTTFRTDNWSRDDWEEKTISYLHESFSKGAIAVKVWKNIGMELLDHKGNFVMIDHPRFDPVFDFIKKNNITLLGHLGEPRNCWLPLEQMTVSGDRNYFSNHPEYHMYLHPEYPSYEDQIMARDQMLEKHPDLRFVGAHLGSLEYSVEELAARLDKYPNMAVDMAERISHLQHQAVTDWQKVYDFMIKYQDRLLYGTDIVDDGSQDAQKLKEHAQEIRLRHWESFTSDENMQVPKVDGTFKGLHLPRKVVDKIYKKNAEIWYPGLFQK